MFILDRSTWLLWVQDWDLVFTVAQLCCAVVVRSWESTCFLHAAMATWRSRFLYHEFVLADLDTWTDETTMGMSHEQLGRDHDFYVACGRWKDDDHIHKKKNGPNV